MTSLFQSAMKVLIENIQYLESLCNISSIIGEQIGLSLPPLQYTSEIDSKVLYVIKLFYSEYGLQCLSSLDLSRLNSLTEFHSKYLCYDYHNTHHVIPKSVMLHVIKMDFLIHLNLDWCTGLSDNTNLGMIGQLDNLRNLSLACVSLVDMDILPLTACALIRKKGLTKLLNLDLSGNGLTKKSLARLVMLPCLKCLDVSCNLVIINEKNVNQHMELLQNWVITEERLKPITTYGWLKSYLNLEQLRNQQNESNSQSFYTLRRSDPRETCTHLVLKKKDVCFIESEQLTVRKSKRLKRDTGFVNTESGYARITHSINPTEESNLMSLYG